MVVAGTLALVLLCGLHESAHGHWSKGQITPTKLLLDLMTMLWVVTEKTRLADSIAYDDGYFVRFLLIDHRPKCLHAA